MSRFGWARAAAVLCAGIVFNSGVQAAAQDELTTIAERSGFKKTGRYDEVERLCKAYAAKWPDAVRCEEFGRTPEGRPMLLLVATRTRALTPEDVHTREIPVLLMQGGIHAGEIDGKDAGFLALREMLEKRAAPNSLDQLVLVFVPVFNIDGHERFGRWNRPNQNGPEEMGWRTNGQNLNLNRDYTKADAPEMQTMLRLLNTWDPIFYADLHVTDGAQFQHDVANLIEPTMTGSAALRPAGTALLKEINDRIAAKGALPLDFYPSFRDLADPASGFALGGYLPRFSTGYWALSNRFALLVETHSWKDYPTRVRITHDIIIVAAEITGREGKGWLDAADRADDEARALGGTKFPLTYESTDKHRMLDFKGYAYTREPSPISGALALRYDPKKPQIWHIPLYDEVKPGIEITVPTGGYVIPAAHAAWLGERLQIHGIEFHTLGSDLTAQNVETFRATKTEFAKEPFEGRAGVTLSGEWKTEQRNIGKGSLFVPIAQAKARLVITLLEPRSPDSYAAWGFFNAHFEQKEYMEPYVAEDVAREMLAKRPEVAAEFQRRLATDPEFAKSPEARLDFFYRLHPSFDERFNLYPIVRTSAPLR
jgi:Zinc carboxypeptidase